MKNIYNIATKIIEKVAVIFGHFSLWLVIILVFLVTFEVVMRYVFNNPPLLADELGTYILVAITYLGMVWVWRQREHLRVDSLVIHLPMAVSNWLRLVTLIFALGFTIAVAYGGFDFLERAFTQHKTSDSWLRVPLAWPQMPITVGFSIMAFLVLVDIVKVIAKIKAGKRVEGGPE
jgi:C4-dicarboxylate transporter DctQ subunit